MRYPASTCAVALATGLLATSAIAQVVDFGKYPDFSGQWDRTGPPNNWVTQSGQPPLTPEYRKVFDASKADQKSGRPGNWPSTFCIPEGMPALMNVYDPLEIVIRPETTYMLTSHNNDMYRRIYTDGRDWPVDPERTLAGYSIGRWIDEAGDGKYSALEIETRFLRGPRAYENFIESKRPCRRGGDRRVDRPALPGRNPRTCVGLTGKTGVAAPSDGVGFLGANMRYRP
jgi:hypothetical protein